VTARAIVLDANILVRAVLGSRVPELLAAHAAQATFLAPDVAFDEAREHLPTILAKRGKPAEAIHAALEKLETLARVIVLVPEESYLPFKDRSLARIGPTASVGLFFTESDQAQRDA
jgi:predicted nucleic acid-binding protein